MRIPGLMVELRVTDLTKRGPAKPEGCDLARAPRAASMFWASFSAAKDFLPTTITTLAVLSILNSTRPALTSAMVRGMSSETVPDFGLGMRPRGPRTRATLRTSFIAGVVETATSKSIQPPRTLSMRSLRPAASAPAARAAWGFSVKTITRIFLPEPLGRETVPRTIWSDCLGSTPRQAEISTVSSNLAEGIFLRISAAAATAWSWARSATLAAAT